MGTYNAAKPGPAFYRDPMTGERALVFSIQSIVLPTPDTATVVCSSEIAPSNGGVHTYRLALDRNGWRVIVGCILYMIAAADVIADGGAMAVPFQAIMGAVFSICLVGVAYLVGLLLRIPAFGRVWYSSALPAVAVIALALGILFSGRSLGLVATFVSPETDTPFQTLHPAAGYSALFAVVFAALHFAPATRAPSTNDRHT